MSIKHPIIAITGSSGAGTTTVQHAFMDIFRREGINAAFVHGNGFRRFTPEQARQKFKAAAERDRPISHFGPQSNYFDRLEGLFREYARSGTGLSREFISNEELASQFNGPIGSYSSWKELPENTDLMFYEGEHGACIEDTWSRRDMSRSHNPVVVNRRHQLRRKTDNGIDVAQWVDLLIGVVPSINLEWIQRIINDYETEGRSPETTVTSILRRLPDYVRYITPQFSLTDINFQRVPLVDTSNPFIAKDVPNADESILVIRFREPKRYDFPYLLRNIDNSYMSRPNTMVVPSGEMRNAMDVICTPLVQRIMEKKEAHYAQHV